MEHADTKVPDPRHVSTGGTTGHGPSATSTTY
jgi:hypothetical protein